VIDGVDGQDDDNKKDELIRGRSGDYVHERLIGMKLAK